MFDGRTTLSRQVAEQVRNHFQSLVLSTVIPRNVRISESPSHGLPVLLYDPASKGAEAYRAAGEELLTKILKTSSSESRAGGHSEQETSTGQRA
jgi:chromosome partitioning protein